MDNVDELKKRIAGEIVLSSTPGETIKKWRQLFKISQTDLAKNLKMSASVISDYESGRRKSPGTKIIDRIVTELTNIDLDRGGKVTEEFMSLYTNSEFSSFILDRKDFERAVKIKDILKAINAEPCYDFEDAEIYGYSIIDSKKAIMSFQPLDLARVSSLINRHCLIFTNLQRGRSPLVAIRLANLKPGLIVLNGIGKVDEIALRIAKLDNLPLAISYASTPEKLIEKLKEFSSKL